MSPSSVFPGFTQGGHTIPHHHQSGDPIDIEFEVKAEEEEAYVRVLISSLWRRDGITGTFIEEDTPTRDLHSPWPEDEGKPSEDCLTLSPDWKVRILVQDMTPSQYRRRRPGSLQCT
ncbi:unnamed protein product, partial [Staurois parvus]